jgi:hypothetical protein
MDLFIREVERRCEIVGALTAQFAEREIDWK